MKLLLQSVKIIDPTSKHHLNRLDVLIEGGVIKQIAKKISPDSKYKIFNQNASI